MIEKENGLFEETGTVRPKREYARISAEDELNACFSEQNAAGKAQKMTIED